MVMRNGNDGADARRWWDDLPPRVRARVSSPEPPETPDGAERASEPPAPEPLFTPGELARDLSRLALLFFALAVANMVFLLVVLSLLRS